MPSFRCKIKKLRFQRILTEKETNRILDALDKAEKTAEWRETMALTTCDEYDCYYNNGGICQTERHCINKPLTMFENPFEIGDVVRYQGYNLTMVIIKVGKNYIEAFDSTGECYYFTGPNRLSNLEKVGHQKQILEVLKAMKEEQNDECEEV